jgi:hypothetical protein
MHITIPEASFRSWNILSSPDLLSKNLAVFLENEVIYPLKPTTADAGHLPRDHTGLDSFMTLQVNMFS